MDNNNIKFYHWIQLRIFISCKWCILTCTGRTDTNIGYVYRRLLDNVPSGIFECNPRCKCKSTCLNRVAQVSKYLGTLSQVVPHINRTITQRYLVIITIMFICRNQCECVFKSSKQKEGVGEFVHSTTFQQADLSVFM